LAINSIFMIKASTSSLLGAPWLRRLVLAVLCWLTGWPAMAQYIAYFSPTAGVAGTPVTVYIPSARLKQVAYASFGYGNVPFTVGSDNTYTTVTVMVPEGAKTSLLSVGIIDKSNYSSVLTSPGQFVVQEPSTRSAIVLDGYREMLYGWPLAVQANPTGFGNATTTSSQAESVGGSELDAVYSYVRGDSLHVLLTGNLENNGNALNVFFDTQAGGQNTLAALGTALPYNNLAGLTFDQGFGADYALTIQVGNTALPSGSPRVSAQFLNLATGVASAPASAAGRATAFGAGAYAGRVGSDQSNAGGVNATATYGTAPASVVTGVEFVLPLAALGSPTGSLKMATLLSNSARDVVANQTLGSLPAGTANLGAPRTVDFGRYADNQYVTVPLQASGQLITSFAPASGVAGTAVTITAPNLAGTSAVRFNGLDATSFVVNSTTSVTAIVPAGATTGQLAVVASDGQSLSYTSFTVEQPSASRLLVNGYREARYGAARAVQTAATGFGNSTNYAGYTVTANGSELDAAYTYVSGDSLYVFLAGNLQNNGQQVELFFDSQAGGQNKLTSTNPDVDSNGLNALAGLTFDTSFEADYYLSIRLKEPYSTYTKDAYTYFASLGSNGVGYGPSPYSYDDIRLPGNSRGYLAIDNANTGGVSDTRVDAGAPEGVVRGIEFSLPLAALGSPVGSIKVAAFLSGTKHTIVSNQVLGGLPGGTANLGAPGAVNFTSYAGTQYFSAPIPSAPPVLTSTYPESGPVGTSVLISGTGLAAATGVSFNGTPAPGFRLTTDKSGIIVSVPAGATAGPITVTSAAGTGSTTTGFCVQYLATVADVSRCGPGPVTLVASGAPAGGSYTYYSSQVLNSVVATGATVTFPNVSYSVQLYVAITTGSGATACEGPRVPVNIELKYVSPATITASGGTTTCQGGQVNLTANYGLAYRWSTGETTQSISTGQAGTYTVTVTNIYGCESTSEPLTVTVNPQPVVTIEAGGPTAICYGGGVRLTARYKSATSYARYYRWSTGETTESIWARNPGNYTVQASDGISCGAVSAATVVTASVPPDAIITASSSTTICVGSSVVLTASPGSAYQWSTGETTRSITAKDAGSYTVTVGDGTCTTTSAPTVVKVNPLPAAYITAAGPTTFCQGGSVVLTASTGASYLWSTGAATQSIVATQGGSYTVQVGNGSCTATSAPTVVVASPEQPTISQTTAGGVTILISSAATGNQWYRNGVLLAGATGQAYTPANSATYTVVVTAANGCVSSASAGLPYVLATASAALAAQVQVYPNPTRGDVTLTLPRATNPRTVQVQVFNALGQLVPARAVVASTGIQLSLTGLATGVYAVRVQLGDDTLVKRVVLE
jgi:hypothetical protein